MCGIAGIFSPNELSFSSKYLDALNEMKNFMKDRGPDGSGLILGENFGLVHTRLAIIDVDQRSNQPMESQSWFLSFNGEIINFKEIRNELKCKYQFSTSSDTEVLLLALEEWGIEYTLSKCAGMFSFIAFNKKNGKFYAARDQMGIKPLFYHIDEDSFWFASNPATIRTGKNVKWQVNKSAIGSYFALGAPFTRMSSTKDISQIPPAHFCEIEKTGKLTMKKYWSPVFQSSFSMDDLISVILQYQHSDVNSALFMSGGIDSSFLAYVMRDLDYFHLNSPEKGYAKKVAKKYQRKLNIVDPKVEDYTTGLNKVIKSFGELYMSCGIPYLVSDAVQKLGYKMAISANGADELFLGYNRTPITQFIGEDLSTFDINRWFKVQLRHIFRNNKYFSIPEFDDYIPQIYDISKKCLELSYLENFSPSANFRWLELMTYVVNDLNPTLDAASMSCSLEVRVPFLDHRIVQGVLSWPETKLFNSKYGRKAPLSSILSEEFGNDFVRRPKLGFSIDSKILSHISRKTESGFEQSIESKQIVINNQYANELYFDRDINYLKSMYEIYSIWSAAGL